MFALLKAYRAELFFLLFLGVIYSLFSATFELNAYTELPSFETAREILAQESWKIPSLQHSITSPLMLGLVSIAFKCFGVSIAVARVPAILLSVLSLLLTYVFCLMTIKSRTTALISSIVLGTSLGFFGLAPLSGPGVLLLDAMLLCLISMQVWRNSLGKRKPQPAEIQNACWWVGISAGILFITQGWLAWLWMGITIALYLANTQNVRGHNQSGHWNWISFATGLALPIGLWILSAAFVPKGWSSLGKFLLTSGIGEFQFFQNNILLDFSSLLLGMFPYIFFLGAFVWEWFKYKRNTGPSHLGQEALVLLASWFVVSLFFAWAFGPQQSIILLIPCMVPLACFAGSYVARFFDGEEPSNPYNWAVEFTIIAIGVGAVLLTIFLFNILSETHPVGFWKFPGPLVIESIHIIKDIPLDSPFPVWKLWLTPGPFILLITAMVLYTLHTMRRSRQAGMMLMVFWLVFLLFMKLLFIPVLQHPVHRENAAELGSMLKPGTTLWIDGTQEELLPTLFYLNIVKGAHGQQLPILISKDPVNDLKRRLESPMYHRTVGVMTEKQYYQLEPETRENLRIVDHRWKWALLNPSHIPQLFNADYMDTLTCNTLVFETLPPDTPIDLKALQLKAMSDANKEIGD